MVPHCALVGGGWKLAEGDKGCRSFFPTRGCEQHCREKGEGARFEWNRADPLYRRGATSRPDDTHRRGVRYPKGVGDGNFVVVPSPSAGWVQVFEAFVL